MHEHDAFWVICVNDEMKVVSKQSRKGGRNAAIECGMMQVPRLSAPRRHLDAGFTSCVFSCVAVPGFQGQSERLRKRDGAQLTVSRDAMSRLGIQDLVKLYILRDPWYRDGGSNGGEGGWSILKP